MNVVEPFNINLYGNTMLLQNTLAKSCPNDSEASEECVGNVFQKSAS